MNQVILLTGRPGCGKTTLIHRLIPMLPKPVHGFYTQEIRQPITERGKSSRLGFELLTMDGQRGVLAHVQAVQVGGRTRPRVGRYIVNLEALNTLALPSLMASKAKYGWTVIDEIGPMEMLSDPFCQAVERLLSREVNILGSIVQRRTQFGDQIKAHPGVTLIELTVQNREEVFDHLRTLIASDQSP